MIIITIILLLLLEYDAVHTIYDDGAGVIMVICKYAVYTSFLYNVLYCITAEQYQLSIINPQPCT